MITDDYVSYETAKLLKEKGFDGKCDCLYADGVITRAQGGRHDWNKGETLFSNYKNECSAPTLQMAMKWLRETFEIHCQIVCPIVPSWMYAIRNLNQDKWVTSYIGDYETYEEACEAAIKYCLKNLIKNEDEEEKSNIPLPKTVDEAISMLEKILSDEDREYLLKNGSISVHHSLGRWIRNEWGLWTDSELKNELKEKGFEHPDDMSNYIIEEFIKHWNNNL